MSRRHRSEAGFTLLEVVIASSLTLVVMLSAYGLLNTSTRTAAAVSARSANSANAREAIDALEANLRYATGFWVCGGAATVTSCVSPMPPGSGGSRTGAATLFVQNLNSSPISCDEWTISQGNATTPGWGGLQEDNVTGTTMTTTFSIPGVMAWTPPATTITGQTTGFSSPIAGLVVIDLLVNSIANASDAPSAFATTDAVSVNDFVAPDLFPSGPSISLSSALSTAAITSLPVNSLISALGAGLVTVGNGSATQIFTTTGAPTGATSIPVVSLAPTVAYPSTSTVTWTSPAPLGAC